MVTGRIGSRASRNDLDAHRLRNLDDLAGGRQGAVLFIDAEDHDVVAVLVGDQQEVAAGIDGEVARPVAAGGFVAQRGEAARGGIDGEDGEAVVPTVRAVEEAPVRREVYVGAVAVALVILREGGDRLQRLQGTPLRVVSRGSPGSQASRARPAGSRPSSWRSNSRTSATSGNSSSARRRR